MFYKKGVLKIRIFCMKTPAPESPFSKAAGLKVATLLKKRLTVPEVFSGELQEQNTSELLLLKAALLHLEGCF